MNILISDKFDSFVVSLDGRYRKYVSDKFLIALLKRRFDEEMAMAKNQSITKIAYDTACFVFEQLLEHDCEASGNGHHVSQSFADCFR